MSSPSERSVTLEEVQKHSTPDDAWVIIDNKVYDVTKFAKMHPGGTKVLLAFAGKDASTDFQYFHSIRVMQKYHDKLFVGNLDKSQASKDEGEDFNIVKMIAGNKPNMYGEFVPYADPNWYQGWNSPYYDESHIKFRNAIRPIVDKEIIPYVHQWEEQKEFPHELRQKLAESGIYQSLLGGQWLTEYCGETLPGGIRPEQFNWFHHMIAVQELNRAGSVGFFWGLCEGLNIGLPPVIHFGSDYLRNKVVKDCLEAKKNICLCITEPWAGSDVGNIQTTAQLTPDGKFYIVNGIKKWITNGIWSDYFTTAVRTGEAGMKGVSLLLLEKGMPGITTRRMNCTGAWASGTTYITLEDVKVPVENMIGKEGHGFKYIMNNFNTERFGFCLQSVALARVCIEDSMKFVHKRKTFGKKLIQHPVIRNKLAQMVRQVEAVSAWVESTGFQMQNMSQKEKVRYLAGSIGLMKANSSMVLEYCAREAVQIFGGLGYTRGGQGERVERIYRDVKAMAIPGGSEEILLDLGVKQAAKYYPKSAKL